MGRWVSYLVFFGVALLITAGVHWYLWARLVRDPAWPAGVTRTLTVLVVGLGVLMPVGMAMGRLLPPSVATPVAWGAYAWMGMAFVLVVIIAGADAARLLVSGASHLWELVAGTPGGAPADPQRRVILARAVAVTAGAGVTAATVHGLRSALGEVETPVVEVPLARLPPALEGLTLVQLTDVHIGPTLGRRFIETLVEKTNAMKPDAVVITGDLVDGSVPGLAQAVAPLRKLAARYGVYFVTGNHEYYSGVGPWSRALTELGMRVLDNERVTLGDAGGAIDLAGIPDPTAGRMGPKAPDIAEALAGRDPERELVVLAHQPRAIDEVARAGAGLQLSGHTHGGQIWPFGAVVGLVQPYVAGLHRHDDTMIYVSRGAGFWGPPLRIAAPAEVTRLVLVGA